MAGLPRPSTVPPARKRVESGMRQPSSSNLRRPSSMRSASSMAPPTTNRSGALSPALSTTSSAGSRRKERDADFAEETNINVVVRCRGRNEREVKENSGVVLSTTGVRGSTLELSMGPSALSNKTYQFDKVFAPAADQAMIYDDVVAPILNEMMEGFNCTIFAYGQTGTGKTYTMSGDMTDNLGMLSDAAGIIPRVLYSLFDKIETGDDEVSVKCSFIELYNEELRDLISADEKSSLKIYEDNKKGHSGTFVQGMEESHVSSAIEGVKLLQKGSYRRQVAATKCNDLSSRSHTVFTITAYVKHPGENGEDVVSAGKLNLVDLAGSENIQRSGAENKRAAEAGLINKSLLTLGRVINALVDKSSHIPYRESKLTRLLQDSLGGRTKTCIIATVSPAKSNLEETISTLDYAFRAKNIRNKPQMNSMINKKTLLRDFTSEIEKLKSELIATRQRNGVYMTSEAHEEMTIKTESMRILNDEQAAKIEAMETSLRNKTQDLYTLNGKFFSLKKEADGTRATLDQTKSVLEQTEFVLADTRKNLEEETILREAHEQTEEKLAEVGSTLLSTIGKTVGDVDGLHAKIQRKSDLHSVNREAWDLSQSEVSSITSMVESRVDEFKIKQEELIATVSAKMQSFVKEELEKLMVTKHFLGDNVKAFDASRAEVTQQTNSAKDEMDNVLGEIHDLKVAVTTNVGEGLKEVNNAAHRITGQVMSELGLLQAMLQESFKGLGHEFRILFDELFSHIKKQKKEIEDLQAANLDASKTIKTASADTAVLIEQLRATERMKASLERQSFMEQFAVMFSAHEQIREQRLDQQLAAVQGGIRSESEKFSASVDKHSAGIKAWGLREDAHLARLTETRETVKTKLQDDLKEVRQQRELVENKSRSVHDETVRIVDEQLKNMSNQMKDLDEFVTRAKKQNAEHHDKHSASLDTLATTVTGSYDNIGSHFDATYDRVKTLGTEMTEQTDTISETLSPLFPTIQEPLAELRTRIRSISMQEYTVTGQTPTKQNYDYPSSLPRTQPHDQIIARFRGNVEGILSPTRSPPGPAIFQDSTAGAAFQNIDEALADVSTDQIAVTASDGNIRTANGTPSKMQKTRLREVSTNTRSTSISSISSDRAQGFGFNGASLPLSAGQLTTVDEENEDDTASVGSKRSASGSLLRQPKTKKSYSVSEPENMPPVEADVFTSAPAGGRRRSPRNGGL